MSQPVQVPRAGMFAMVRNRRGVVTGVEPFDGQSGRLHLVRLDYKDDQTSTRTLARLLIGGDAENLVAVTAECVMSTVAPPTTWDACETALRSLTPDIPVDARVVLALAPEGTEPPPPSPTGSGTIHRSSTAVCGRGRGASPHDDLELRHPTPSFCHLQANAGGGSS